MSNRYPPEEIVPALTHHNREARRYAAMILGVRQDDQLVPFLADLLQSGSVPARRAAAHALGTPTRPLLVPDRAVWSAPTIDRLAVESLTASLIGDADAVVRANSAQGLGALGRIADWRAWHRDEPMLDLLRSDTVALPLINALLDPVAVVRTQVATSLNILAIPAALPALIPLLRDPDREVRIAAAFAAGKLGSPQSLPVLLDILRNGPREARRQAAVSLRFLGDAEAVPALIEALGDPSRSVREEAAVALGHLGDPQAVPALVNALTDANIMAEECRSLREYLVAALQRLGDCRAVPALVRALDDYDRQVRNAAVGALAQLGGPQAEDALIGIVDREMCDDRPRSAIRQVIGHLGSMGAVRAMPTLRMVIEEGYRQWVPAAAGALRQLGDTITAGDMVVWLSSPDSDYRLRAVLALPGLVDRAALSQLRHALADDDATVRAAAARQLGRVGDRSVVPFLSDALQDQDEDVRRAARASFPVSGSSLVNPNAEQNWARNPPLPAPITRSQSSSTSLILRPSAVIESWAAPPLSCAMFASVACRLIAESKSMSGKAWGRNTRSGAFMSPSLAVLRIWAHPDMGMLCHSSEERFRGACFPLGSAIVRFPDSGSAWIPGTSMRTNSALRIYRGKPCNSPIPLRICAGKRQCDGPR